MVELHRSEISGNNFEKTFACYGICLLIVMLKKKKYYFASCFSGPFDVSNVTTERS